MIKKTLKCIPKRYTAILCILLSIIILINVLSFTQFSYLIYNDNPPPTYHFVDVYRSLFTWSNIEYTGVTSIVNSIPLIIFNLFGDVVSRITNIILGLILSLWLIFTIGAVGTFLLIKEITKDIGPFQSNFGGLIGAILFSLPIIRYTILIPALLFPITLLFLIRYVKVAEANKHAANIYFPLSILSLACLFSVDGAGYLLQNSFIIIVLSVTIIITARRGVRVSHFKSLLAIFLIALLINASWIINPAFFSKSGYTGYFNEHFSSFDPPASLIVENLFLFAPFPVYLLTNYISLTLIPIFAISLFAIIAIFRRRSINSRLILGLFIAYIILAGLGSMYGKPFNPVFDTILSAFPYIKVINTPSLELYYFVAALFSILFGVGVAIICNKPVIRKSLYLKWFSVLLIIAITLSFLYLNAYNTQLLNNASFKIQIFHYIPSYVFNASEYINSQNGDFGIATLPSVLNWQTTTSYIGVNLYSDFIYTHPVYTGGETAYDYLIYPPSSNEYATYIGLPLSSGSLSKNVDLSNGFGIFGIKYIILQTDAIQDTNCYCIGHYTFNMSFIKSTLASSKGLSLEKTIGNATIYSNDNYVPFVYASNIINLGNASTSEIFGLIENKTFNIQNSSVYSSDDNYSGIQTDPANLITISKFVPPQIAFTESSPVSTIVHISNATTPYYLVFRDTYNPNWGAFYPNGTQLSNFNHILVNGFANAWYVNKLGNYTITLYYTSQTIALIAWGISFIGLGITLYLLYTWLKINRLRSVGNGKRNKTQAYQTNKTNKISKT